MRIIDSVRVYHYRLPLIHPVFWWGVPYSFRSGLLICLRDGEFEGWGEIAPLPGFSQESLSEARNQTVCLAKEICKSSLQSHDLESLTLLPSVQFGYELANFNLNADSSGQPLFVADSISCCKLISDQNSSQIDSIRYLAKHGYQAVKIKVGRRTLNEDLDLLHMICKENPQIEVRVDANRAWGLKTAMNFLHATKHLDIGYIEEPLKDKSRLIEFAHSSHIPLALDETLREPEAELFRPLADVLVYKPTLSGGITSIIKEIHQSQTGHPRYVISSSYESGVGMLGLIELARTIPQEIHGLGTYGAFKHDVTQEQLPLLGPNLYSEKRFIKQSDLDMNSLELIYQVR